MKEIGCGIVLYDENKRILIQHRDSKAKINPNSWGFFGGGLKKGETPEDCVKRECKEELGYELKNPLLMHKTKSNLWESYIFIEKYNPSKKLTLKEGNKMKWVNLNSKFEVSQFLKSETVSEELVKRVIESINNQT